MFEFQLNMVLYPLSIYCCCWIISVSQVDKTSPFALTGAVFGKDR